MEKKENEISKLKEKSCMDLNFENTCILDVKNNKLGITDKELIKYIQFKLGKNDFKIEELKEIKEIIIDGKTFTGAENKIDFDNIDFFENLTEIEIRNTNISKDDINKIKNIEKVTLQKCDVESIEILTNVKCLSLKSCFINNFEEIKKLKQIEELQLINIEIDNFEFLQELNNLKKLIIKNVKEFELSKINFYLPIEYFSVEDIEVLNIEDIKKFTNLKFLSIDKEKTSGWKDKLEEIEKSGVKIILNDIYNY